MKRFTNKNTTLEISPFTGALYVTTLDMLFPGKGMDIALRRCYNSFITYDPGRPSHCLGLKGWTFDFEDYLYFDESDDSITLFTADMKTGFRFVKDNGNYIPFGAYNKLQLTDNNDGTITITYQDKSEKIFDSVKGLLIRLRDTIGNEIKYIWEESGNESRVSKIIDTSGRTLNFSYAENSTEFTTTVTDWMNRTFTYIVTKNENGEPDRLTSYTDPGGNITSYDYEGSLLLNGITLPGGLWVSATSLGPRPDMVRVGSLSFASGLVVSYSYDWANNKTTVTAGERTEIFEFNAAGNLISYTDPLNNEFTYTYNSARQILTVTDPRNGVTTYTYDPDTGMRTSIEDQLGNVTAYEYNDPNWQTNVTKIISPTPFSYETEFTYDPDTGKLLTTTDTLGKVTTNTYYDSGYKNGLLHTVTDPNGNTVTYDYGYHGELISVTNPLGKVSNFTYDSVGNLLTSTDPLGDTISYEYDSSNRLTKTADPLGKETRFEYNSNGMQVSVTDADNRTTRNAFDASNRLLEVMDTVGNKVRYDYDVFDNVISVIDANGHITEFEYDGIDRVTTITDPLGRKTAFSRTPYYETDIKTDPNGHRATSEFSLLLDLTKTAFHDDSFFRYIYDNLRRKIEITQPGKYYGDFKYGDEKYGYDPTEEVNYEYDAMNRLTKITYPGNKTIEYAYDDAGRLTTLTDINSETTTYTYDDANRILTAAHGGNTTEYTYDDSGRMTEIAYPNGVTGNFSYDDRGNITQILWQNSSGILYDIQYTYDSIGNRIRKTVEQPPSPVRRYDYGYDSLSRLVSVFIDGQLSAKYAYDPNGNRLEKETPDGIIDYGCDACDQLNFADNAAFSYDLNGNLVEKLNPEEGTTAYTWNYDNRLIKITYPDNSESKYRYNSEGLRIWKQDKDGEETNFYWNKNTAFSDILNETDESGDPKASYIYGNRLIAIKKDSAYKYYIYDALGSILALSDDSGLITDRYDYDEYGIETTHSGSSYNNFRYTAQYTDPDNNLLYLRNRYYDPEIGRFISRDPIASIEKYTYCNNEPIKHIDPSGMGPVDEVSDDLYDLIYNIINNMTPGDFDKIFGGDRDQFLYNLELQRTVKGAQGFIDWVANNYVNEILKNPGIRNLEIEAILLQWSEKERDKLFEAIDKAKKLQGIRVIASSCTYQQVGVG